LEVESAGLDDELKAADKAGGFLSPLNRPAHLHEGGNGNRRIENGEIAAHKGGRLEGTRAKDAHASIA
jgi:hypothetical protein